HSRGSGDWSSDVCSSDLKGLFLCRLAAGAIGRMVVPGPLSPRAGNVGFAHRLWDYWLAPVASRDRDGLCIGPALAAGHFVRLLRSEERRVGKWGRVRWSP